MASQKEQKKVGRESLKRAIDMCIAIEAHIVDPFTLNVDDIIEMVKKYFPSWERPEDFNLDSKAIHHLASVIKLQSEWVKHRSTSLYTDPFLLEAKIKRAPIEEMASLFLKAWQPLVELEQISIHSLNTAIHYWKQLVPIKERWKETKILEVAVGTATKEELIDQRVLSDKPFSEELEQYWLELKQTTQIKGQGGKMHYWDFIGGKTYEETVRRAFIASFLITYGYATLEVYPLEEEIFIKPFETPVEEIITQQSISIPIAVTCKDWQKWKRGELI